ncbi:MAG: zf-HC2 domain-containing protein, partial [Actinomycetota bacterium]|nr:zf-HC2 domain-containing protein [Actinomycetota bacterium]
MSEDLSHSEIQELLGAYALDAVDDSERTVIEAHLRTCASCQAELDDHRRLAETLRRHAIRVSPLASTESNGSARTDGAVKHPRRLRGWRVPTAAAIALVLVGGLFVQGEVRYHHLAATTIHIELLERAQLAAADPAAVVTQLRSASDEPMLTVVDRGRNSYAVNSSLPRLTHGQTYQLWRV